MQESNCVYYLKYQIVKVSLGGSLGVRERTQEQCFSVRTTSECKKLKKKRIRLQQLRIDYSHYHVNALTTQKVIAKAITNKIPMKRVQHCRCVPATSDDPLSFQLLTSSFDFTKICFQPKNINKYRARGIFCFKDKKSLRST